ncbi:hypothetical protein [Pararhodobacter zhoushanensis]|uniref:Molybdopterin guanine dinucleotide synthesis n=1 Tax=Pararhodobacter zhoushanensis TaxID=2479545 RepID=A0ABT3GX71_9RHOB|nr:hypothetical protein [Pararhodobacter zhoushanensis]MCW1404173.1 hypothetical protein [Novosphingobium sp. MW5]MCW1932144.1 molybdopterin guanine dinucleotide synthesis [Pararhodobacter zhoushanensis]
MTFDRIAILDWSAANTPRRGKDSIWLGLDDGTATNPCTRAEAFDELCALVETTLARRETLLIGADFAFGYPAGFAQALTGRAEALAVWDWLASNLHDDAQNRSNRIALAAQINARLPGLGPFWFNPTRLPFPDLPHKGSTRHGTPFAEHRLADETAKGAQSPWKLGGAGAVGSQILTGLPVLHRLRTAFPGQIAVWPFEPLSAPVVLAEVFPSLLGPEVTARLRPGSVKDRMQVTLLARALARQADLKTLLTTPDDARIREEGWILGLGHEKALRDALI